MRGRTVKEGYKVKLFPRNEKIRTGERKSERRNLLVKRQDYIIITLF